MVAGNREDDRASIAEQAREAFDRLTARERKAAQMLLANYPTAGLAPVAEFAERAQVSAPTVLRFVAKLGFLGYPDFQRQLREELEAQLASPLAKPLRSRRARNPHRAAIDPFLESAIANLQNTFRHVGYSGSPGDSDISMSATGVQNCIDHNVDRTGGKRGAATVDPPNPVGLSDCGNSNPGRGNLGRGIYSPGDPISDVMTALNAAGITEPKDYKGPGPHPEAQLTMANPCVGAPANPWCRDGRPVVTPPSSPGR